MIVLGILLYIWIGVVVGTAMDEGPENIIGFIFFWPIILFILSAVFLGDWLKNKIDF